MTEVTVDIQLLKKMSENQKQLIQLITNCELKINSILTKSEMIETIGDYKAFVSNFSKFNLKGLLTLDEDKQKWRGYHLTFIRYFLHLLYLMDSNVMEIKEYKKTSVTEQRQRYRFWMCCVLYLTVVTVEEYYTDIDVNFKKYFIAYLEEHFRTKDKHNTFGTFLREVTDVFNSELIWLMNLGVYPDLYVE